MLVQGKITIGILCIQYYTAIGALIAGWKL